jgi:bacterioferritin
MGTSAKKNINLNVNNLIKELNKAVADEYLAYHGYMYMAKIAVGKMSFALAKEIEETAKEELEHAQELIDRILILGGKPLDNPKEWLKEANCSYPEAPKKDSDTNKMAKIIVEAEQCAIKVYNKLLEMTKGKDEFTYQLVLHILGEELEHEDTFERFLVK